MSINIGTLDIGVAFAGDTAGLQKATADAQQDVDRFGASTSKAMRQVREDTKGAEDALGRLSQGLKGAVIGSSVAVGLITLKNTAMEAAGAIIQAQVQLDKLNNGFKFGGGGAAGGARELAFVREEANRLGLELGGAAAQYMKMVAAARGTNMEGAKTRELFTSIAEASTVMGMSGEQSERAMMAVVQMMSKGKVQAEELRGQLGEHLPGAFAIAARAMGVTEVELNKLMETGQVMSADFLPKFAAQLRNELGGSVEDATKSMQASLNRYETAWLNFKQNVAQSGVSDAMGWQINILSDAFNGISERMEAARKAGGGFWSQTAAGAGGVAQFLNPINALSYSAISLQGQLEQAKTKLNELEKERPYSGNIFLGPAIEETKQLIAELERAKAARDQLTRQPGTGASESRYSAMADAEATKAQQAKGYAYAKLMGDMATPQEKLTEAIFKAKQELGELYSPEIEARLREHFIKPTREAKKEVDDLTKAAVRGEKLFGDLSATEGGLAGDFAEKWGDLSAAYAKTYINAEQLLAAQAALLKLQPFYKKGLDEEKEAAKEQAKATAEAAKAYDAYYDAVQKNTDTLQGSIQSENDAAAAIGLSAIAIAELEAAKLQDMAASKERAALTWESIDLSGEMTANLRAEAKALRDLAAAKVNRAVKDTAYDEAKKAADAWQKASEQIEKDITDALMRGFESGKDFAMVLRDTVVNMFKTMVLRPVISAIVSPVAGAITGSLGLAGAANAGQGGNLLGTASNLSSLYNLGGSLTGIGGIASSASILSGSTYGTAALSQQSIMLAAQEAGVAVGSSTAASLSSFASAALPVAAAAAALAAVGAFRTTKTVGSGIMGTLGEGGQVNSYDLRRKSGYLFGGPDYSISDKGVSEQNKALQNAFTTMRTATIGMAGALGLGSDAIKGFTTTIGKELIHPDTGGLGLKFDGLTPEQTAAKVQAALADANVDMAQFVLMEMARAEVSPDVIAAARAAGDAGLTTITGTVADMLGDGAGKVGQLFGKFFGNVMGQAEGFIAEEAAVAEYLAQFVKDGETADQTLSRLSTSLTTVNATWDALGFTLEAVSLAGGGAASSFIDLMGGLENFTAATAGYYANFYTETERAQFATEQLSSELGKLGQTMPTTRDGFRALIEAAEKAGDNALLAGLLNLQDEFAALVPAAEDATAAMTSVVNGLKSETKSLQRELLVASGGDVRAFDIKGMDASSVAIYDYNQSLRDQISAANAATKANEAATQASEAAAEAARARAEAVAQERDGLNRQLLAATGDTAAIRALEIAALDASNRAIQEHIWAIEDTAAAYEKATNAAQAAYSTLERSAEAERGKLTDTYTVEREAITERLKIQQQGYQAQITAAQTAADKIRDIASALSTAVGQVRVDSPTINRAAYDAARGVIGTNNINDPRLQAALQSVSGDNKQFYGKFEDYAFEQAVTAANIRSMDATAQSQLSAAEAMINSIKASDSLAQVIAEAELAALEERHNEQLAQLQAELDLGKSQLDALLGIDTSVLSVADAVAALGGAISAAYAAQSAQIAAATAAATTSAAASQAASGGTWGGEYYTDSQGNQVELQTGQSRQFWEAVAQSGTSAVSSLAELEQRLADKGKTDVFDQLVSGFNFGTANFGGSLDYATVLDSAGGLVAVQGLLGSDYTEADRQQAIEAFGKTWKVPGYAVGTPWVPEDGLAYLHKGEAVVPAQFNPFNPGASAPGNSEVVAELRQLNERMSRIEATNAATAGHTAATDRKLARVIKNDAITTEAVTA